MLMLSLLVIPVGFKSFIFFFLFSLIFFTLAYKYTINVIKCIFRKIKVILFKIKAIKKLESPKKEQGIKKRKFEIDKKQSIDKDKIKVNKDRKTNWKKLNHENLSINKTLKQIKLNTKIYDYGKIQTVELIVNSKKVDFKQLKKIEKIKSVEIKIGTKIKKITFRHFKYNVPKENIKKFKNNIVKDYKKLISILKNNLHQKNKNN